MVVGVGFVAWSIPSFFSFSLFFSSPYPPRQMVYNEGVVDMQWFPDHPHWIVVGTHLKWLR